MPEHPGVLQWWKFAIDGIESKEYIIRRGSRTIKPIIELHQGGVVSHVALKNRTRMVIQAIENSITLVLAENVNARTANETANGRQRGGLPSRIVGFHHLVLVFDRRQQSSK